MMLATPLELDTPFGAFTADGRAVVTFAQGLPGFESCRRFVLVTATELAPFTCLHGLDAPRPSFLALDPRRIVAGYRAVVSATDRRRLSAEAEAPLVWLAVVRIDADGAVANLRAPIVVNPLTMAGVQILDVDPTYSTDHRIAQG